MPPLPPSPSAQLTSLQRRLHDIRTHQLPRLASLSGPLSQHAQYASELRDDLDAVTRGVRRLEVGVEDEDDEGVREMLGEGVRVLKGELERTRKEARAVVLQSKKRIESTSNRSELLSGAGEDLALEKTDDALTNKSNEVTLALRRTMQLMQQEVERSVLSTQMLDSSSRTLHTTSTTYERLTGLLGTSRALITALERADWMDRALVFAALAFFLLVVAFILKQRVLDRGVRLAFWWVRFLPSFGDEGLGVEDADVLRKGRESVRVVTSVLTAVTTTASAVAASMSSMSSAAAKPSVVVESVTSVITVSRTVDDIPTSPILEKLASISPSHTIDTDDYLASKPVSPTEVPEPEAEEVPALENTYPNEAIPLEDPFTAAPPPPAAASPPSAEQQRVHAEL